MTQNIYPIKQLFRRILESATPHFGNWWRVGTDLFPALRPMGKTTAKGRGRKFPASGACCEVCH